MQLKLVGLHIWQAQLGFEPGPLVWVGPQLLDPKVVLREALPNEDF